MQIFFFVENESLRVILLAFITPTRAKRSLRYIVQLDDQKPQFKVKMSRQGRSLLQLT